MNTLFLQQRQIQFSTKQFSQAERQLLATTGLLGEFAETDEATGTYYEELGDFMWYVHLMCMEIDISFASIIDNGLEQCAEHTQVAAYQALCKISETFKKVAVTKQKPLDRETKLKVADSMVVAVAYLFGRLANDTWSEVMDVLNQNIDKLTLRQKIDFRAKELPSV